MVRCRTTGQGERRLGEGGGERTVAGVLVRCPAVTGVAAGVECKCEWCAVQVMVTYTSWVHLWWLGAQVGWVGVDVVRQWHWMRWGRCRWTSEFSESVGKTWVEEESIRMADMLTQGNSQQLKWPQLKSETRWGWLACRQERSERSYHCEQMITTDKR